MSPSTAAQIHRSPEGGAGCPNAQDETRPERRFQPIFPPPDADNQTRRAWLASTPWPEVLFASAR